MEEALALAERSHRERLNLRRGIDFAYLPSAHEFDDRYSGYQVFGACLRARDWLARRGCGWVCCSPDTTGARFVRVPSAGAQHDGTGPGSIGSLSNHEDIAALVAERLAASGSGSGSGVRGASARASAKGHGHGSEISNGTGSVGSKPLQWPSQAGRGAGTPSGHLGVGLALAGGAHTQPLLALASDR